MIKPHLTVLTSQYSTYKLVLKCAHAHATFFDCRWAAAMQVVVRINPDIQLQH